MHSQTLRLSTVLCLLPLFVSCVSRGSAARKLGDDHFEVRAWDGYGCKKEADNNTCFSLLMPVIKERAEEKCEGEVELISLCLRYEAMSADRIVCKVNCKQGDEEVSEDEDEAAGEENEEGGGEAPPPEKKPSDKKSKSKNT